MSTKKDKFTKKDNKYMSLALNLARARHGLTGENPSVGCVIVKNDEIISIGQTGIGGRPHAEFNAIKNSYENLKNTKMYVTLEPCNHYGKTPPCTNIITKNKIAEVIYSIDDIDKKVREWNSANPEPLREGYLLSQLNWHKRQKEKILPPNYDNNNYYRDLQIPDPDHIMKKFKNPVNYAILMYKRSKK